MQAYLIIFYAIFLVVYYAIMGFAFYRVKLFSKNERIAGHSNVITLMTAIITAFMVLITLFITNLQFYKEGNEFNEAKLRYIEEKREEQVGTSSSEKVVTIDAENEEEELGFWEKVLDVILYGPLDSWFDGTQEKLIQGVTQDNAERDNTQSI